jgi:hypothetical protein
MLRNTTVSCGGLGQLNSNAGKAASAICGTANGLQRVLLANSNWNGLTNYNDFRVADHLPGRPGRGISGDQWKRKRE